MNTDLLLKVKAAILDEPKRLNIWEWQGRWLQGDEAPACGTVGCIAGWLDILSKTNGSTDIEAIKGCPLNEVDAEEAGEIALGVARGYALGLFIPSRWPHDLYLDLKPTIPGTPEHASVVAAVIDRFIADPEEFFASEDIEDEDDEESGGNEYQHDEG